MQVMDFVGREDLVERGMATITAPTVAAEETNFRWESAITYLLGVSVYFSSSLFASFFFFERWYS